MTLEIAIPDTSLSNCNGLREKTVKIGQIARISAVCRVDSVLIYKTKKQTGQNTRDSALLIQILKFLDTPQYLRKLLFPRMPSLRYAGLLPPLRTAGHPLEADTSNIVKGDLRWGLQVGEGRIEIGVERPIEYHCKMSTREPTLFRILSTSPAVVLEEESRSNAEKYVGFDVSYCDDFISYLEEHEDATRIVFSRNAPDYSYMEEGIRNSVEQRRTVLCIFGGPTHGVSEIFEERRAELKKAVDYWINTIPDQGTATVRLEEAMGISLGLLNNSIGSLICKPGFHSEHAN